MVMARTTAAAAESRTVSEEPSTTGSSLSLHHDVSLLFSLRFPSVNSVGCLLVKPKWGAPSIVDFVVVFRVGCHTGGRVNRDFLIEGIKRFAYVR
jgi:hypothetical protein